MTSLRSLNKDISYQFFFYNYVRQSWSSGLYFLVYLLRPPRVVTTNHFPYTACNVALPVSDVTYKQGSKEGVVSYIRPAFTYTNIKEPVDAFSFNVKTTYRNRRSEDLRLSTESQKEGSVGRYRLFQASDIHIQEYTATRTVRTKSESFTR